MARAGRSPERDTRGSAIGSDAVFFKEPSAEPGPERPAAKRQERGNRSTSVETTGHLSVRAPGGAVAPIGTDARPGSTRLDQVDEPIDAECSPFCFEPVEFRIAELIAQ